MKIDVITLFPDMFDALNHGIVGKAIRNRLLQIKRWNPRDYTDDPKGRVDDRPYGGGPGMVMQYQPLAKTIEAVKTADPSPTTVIYLSPQGKPLTHAAIEKMSQKARLTLVSGRYEGIDERVIEKHIDEEWSVGDYVVSGGEFPAMLLIDALTRLLPGALGHEDSAQQDSFSQGLLDCPHYTRPELIEDQAVPEVLLSGDHQAIKRWRLQQALLRTWQKRPDLLKRRGLSKEEQAMLDEYKEELP